jgi:hypothetical protein
MKCPLHLDEAGPDAADRLDVHVAIHVFGLAHR